MTSVAKPPIAANPAQAGVSASPVTASASLRIELSALGIDNRAPDFADRFFRMAGDNEPC